MSKSRKVETGDNDRIMNGDEDKEGTKEEEGIMLLLPPELLEIVLRYLNYEELVSLRFINKTHKAIVDCFLWRNFKKLQQRVENRIKSFQVFVKSTRNNERVCQSVVVFLKVVLTRLDGLWSNYLKDDDDDDDEYSFFGIEIMKEVCRCLDLTQDPKEFNLEKAKLVDVDYLFTLVRLFIILFKVHSGELEESSIDNEEIRNLRSEIKKKADIRLLTS